MHVLCLSEPAPFPLSGIVYCTGRANGCFDHIFQNKNWGILFHKLTCGNNGAKMVETGIVLGNLQRMILNRRQL